MHVLERVDQGGAESTTFCDVSPLQTESYLGVRTCVRKYGPKTLHWKTIMFNLQIGNYKFRFIQQA